MCENKNNKKFTVFCISFYFTWSVIKYKIVGRSLIREQSFVVNAIFYLIIDSRPTVSKMDNISSKLLENPLGYCGRFNFMFHV